MDISFSTTYSTSATLSNFSVDDNGDRSGTINLTSDKDSTAYIWIGPTGTTPTAQEVKDGTGANETLTQAITVFGGPYDLTLPDTLDGDYRVSVVAQVGAGPLSNVVTQSPVAFSTVPAGFTVEHIFRDHGAGFATSRTFSVGQVLDDGMYLVFCFVDQNSVSFAGGSLEGTAFGSPEATGVKNSHTTAVYAVEITGGGNQELVITTSSATTNVSASLVYVGAASVAEAESASGTGGTQDYTFANTADGKIIVGWQASGDHRTGYTNLTALEADLGYPEYTTATASTDVSGGSPTTVSVDFDGTFMNECGVAIKVVESP